MTYRRLSLIALLTALGGAVHLLETLIPFPLPVPGGRWGFSNSVILIALPGARLSDLLVLAIAKSTLGAFFGGRLVTPMYLMSVCGLTVAVTTMWAISRKNGHFGLVGISLAGAITNNTVQLAIAAAFIIRNVALFLIYPYFLILGSIAAVANAAIAYSVLKRAGGKLWETS